MKMVFFSNYLTHHQLPLCNALYRLTGGKFTFVATEPIEQERLDTGWQDLNREYNFVLQAYAGEAEKHRAMQLAEEADVVIHGSAPRDYLAYRLQRKKLAFLYSERIYKTGYQWWKLPVRLWRFYKNYGRHRNLYLLSASAFAAADFARTFTFINKAYKWGYFPEVKRYDDMGALIEKKRPGTILWAGRFLGWKHPEHVVEVARRLKEDGYAFQIRMIGYGEIWDDIKRMVQENGLEGCTQLLGAVPAEEVRTYMEEAAVYLFTSDRNEGWGAVLNESMNSACAVVASDAIGSVPFLLNEGENGLTYRAGNVDELYEKVKFLLDNPERGKELGRAAYETMIGMWNAETAAERLMELSEALLRGEKHPNLFGEGPCSRVGK